MPNLGPGPIGSKDGDPSGAVPAATDSRLTVYRTSDGRLMCRSMAGLLSSEVPIRRSVCGARKGCDGQWLCLGSGARPDVPPSAAVPIGFISKA